MKKILVYGLLGCIGWCGSLSAQTNANAVFDKLRALSGDWEGTVAWTGQPASEIAAQYSVTGKRSAVVEQLSNEMTSVYYLDGTDLRMTHFCAAQNQPRLKANAYGRDKRAVTFPLLTSPTFARPGTFKGST
jgi:hypothetical protein